MSGDAKRADNDNGDGSFKCGLCGETFNFNVDPDYEAKAEAESHQHFGDIPLEEKVAVCDDCWAKIHPNRN